ncbi:hypothetical protein NC653_039303 [Populus alba x Populus x berolinensis]|uniref:Uncharacterized protein n=1 Tax=Populus alba x Populus x berolinensis TaxID=444605 RepID=A0AAD6LAV0_9ROSI|nr:hypothetical protein NC653_039303 [Populus alba x Populus x berolinensis]
MLFESCSSRPTNQFYRFVRCRVFTLVEQHGFMAKKMAANPINPLDPIMPRHYFMFIYSPYVLSLGKVSRILAALNGTARYVTKTTSDIICAGCLRYSASQGYRSSSESTQPEALQAAAGPKTNREDQLVILHKGVIPTLYGIL